MKKIIDRRFSIVIGIFVLFIIFLTIAFPILHDDLLHGTIGLGFNFMPHVNGRYLGNFFGIALASNIFLRVIIKSLIIILILYVAKKILKVTNKIYLVLFISLFLFMPKEMFRETFPFTSGFANYVIPIVGILFVIHLHLNNQFQKNNICFCICLLLLGIFNSLFVEHITIFNLLLSIYVLLYDYIKNKKINYNVILYFIGSLLGSIIMFTNPTYLVVFKGADEYRSFSSIKELFTKPWAILRATFFHNHFINLVLIFLISIIYINKIQTKSLITKIIMFYLWLFIFYTFIKIFNPYWFILDNYMKPFEALITAGFFIGVIYMLFVSKMLNKSEIYRLSFYVISMISILAPLVVVSPLGPRCYIFVYIIMIILAVDLLMIFTKNKLININYVFDLFFVLVILQMISYLYIYGSIYLVNTKRLKLIDEQISQKVEKIDVINLPFQDYLHVSNFCSDYSKEVFKNYYSLPNNIEIDNNCD